VVTYSAPIAGASGVGSAPLADFCYDGDVLTATDVPNVPICLSGDLTVKVNPKNNHQLYIYVSTPVTGIKSGTFSIWGLRFNTTGLSASSYITATVSVYVQNQVFPLEFITPTANVGQIGYNPTYGWGSVAASVGAASSILTCYMGKSTDFTVDVVEQWAGAWTSASDENFLAPYLAPNPGTLGSEIAITLTGVPSGATVAAVSTGTTGLGTGFTWVSSTPTPVVLSNGNYVFVYELASTTRDEVEGASFTFSITTTGAITTQLAPVTASVTLAPNTPASPPPYPAFTYATSGPNQEEPFYPLTLITFLGCQTDLLFPYVTNYTSGGSALGNWDTGIVVANTSSDPFASETTILGDVTAGATPTAGSCTFYVYASTSGSLTPSADASPVHIFTRSPVYTGGVDSFLLSSTPAKGTPAGYMIAVCNFLDGTGYALIADNANGLGNWGVMGNYLAYVIPNPFEDPRWYNAQWGEFAITPFPFYNYYFNSPLPNARKGQATHMRAPNIH
jgi:hypothetical protein